MAQRILGLDLGASAVKGVLLESAFRGFSVAAAASVSLPDGPSLLERQAAAVKALLAESGWRPESTMVAFPGAGAASHVVTLPFTDTRRIEQTVQFEVEGQIPFDLAQVAWDWQPIGSRGGKTDLYVGVVRREELSALLAALSSAGVDPRVVMPPGPAYASLFATGILADPGDPIGPGEAAADALLDIGRERSSVCVVTAGECESARTFAGGSLAIVRTLAADLGIAEPDANRLLDAASTASSAEAADPRISAATRRGVAPVVRELRATLRAWQARVGRRPVRRVVLAGEAARLPGLPEILAPEAEGPVAPLALAGPTAEAFPSDRAPGLALALALALRGHQGPRTARLNLRRGDLAYTRDFQHVRGKAVRLGVYAALVLLLAIVSAGAKSFALGRQEALLDRSLCEITQKVVGRCFESFETAEAVLKGKGTPTAAIPRMSAVDVFAELASRAPADVHMKLDRIELTRDKLHLQGTTDAAENVDRIVSALKTSRCFGDARSGGARRRGSDGKFEFTVDSDLTCDGAPAGAGRD